VYGYVYEYGYEYWGHSPITTRDQGSGIRDRRLEALRRGLPDPRSPNPEPPYWGHSLLARREAGGRCANGLLMAGARRGGTTGAPGRRW
jgi:hypothetical protein